MDEKELLESWLLCSIRGIGAKSIRRLIVRAGSAANVEKLPHQLLTGLIGEKRAALLEKGMDQKELTVRKTEFFRMKEKNIFFLPFWHENYPVRLKNIPDAPAALYGKGRIPDEGKKTAAVIGARSCSNYGREATRYFAQGLAQAGVIIVSGLARGVDGIAGTAALSCCGQSIAVLGCGVDICYPPENRPLYNRLEKEGCILSEYLPGTKPEARLFPPRNRIISGLSDLVLVTEAREKSGTLITVDMALEQGREVFAVPGRINDSCSRGCNELIASGAGAALSVEQLLSELGMEGNSGNGGKESADIKTRELSGRELVLKALESDPKSLDELCRQVNSFTGSETVTLPRLMHEMMLLCMEGKAAEEGGRYYAVRSF